VLFAAFLQLQFMFVIFCLKIVGVKAARKMLVKLTTGRRTRKYISWGLIETIQKDTTVHTIVKMFVNSV
jgi:hypothetical protein